MTSSTKARYLYNEDRKRGKELSTLEGSLFEEIVSFTLLILCTLTSIKSKNYRGALI